MTADEKIIRLAEAIANTDIDVGEIVTFLSMIGKLDSYDATKVIWAAIGTANALSCTHSEKQLEKVCSKCSSSFADGR